MATATDDGVRLSHRAGRKESIAELKLLRRKVEDKDRNKTSLLRRIEEATNEHATRCYPIQQRLGEIERRIIDADANGKHDDAGLEAERQNLAQQLLEAKLEHEQKTAALRNLVTTVEMERHRLTMQLAELPALENSLAQEGLGNPELLNENWVAQRSIELAAKRRDIARNEVVALEEAIAESDPISHEKLERRLSRWKAEYSFAGAQFSAAQQKAAEIRKQLMDE